MSASRARESGALRAALVPVPAAFAHRRSARFGPRRALRTVFRHACSASRLRTAHTRLVRLRISWALPCHGFHRTADSDHLGQGEYAAATLATACSAPPAALVSPRVIVASSVESYILHPRNAAEERGAGAVDT
ncbi:hypothetical protein FB451DRAFT_1184789 [Mycena latifolia]|nr:hypothetical protein FB451DRAFT_1184789 [Mycena latifolia]